MTDIKTVFEHVLDGEPTVTVPLHEDLARGRALRSRRRRNRLVTGATALGVVWAGVLIVPALVGDQPGSMADSGEAADEVWPYETPARPEPVTGPPPTSASLPLGETLTESAALATAWVNSPVENQLWRAVRPVLPGDLALADEKLISRRGNTGQGLELVAVRGDTAFVLEIAVQQISPDTARFRPCTEPAEIPGGLARWEHCSQGYDGEGRWRVVGQAGGDTGVAVAAGGTAAVTVRWSTDLAGHDPLDEVPEGSLSDTLTPEEANAIAEASWGVASRYTPAELAEGTATTWDIEALAADWSRVEAALEVSFGPLEDASVERPAPTVITASYTSAEAGRVVVAVWAEHRRRYESLCHELAVCAVWPGSTEFFAPLINDDVGISGGILGDNRMPLFLSVDGVTGSTEDPVFERPLARFMNALSEIQALSRR